MKTLADMICASISKERERERERDTERRAAGLVQKVATEVTRLYPGHLNVQACLQRLHARGLSVKRASTTRKAPLPQESNEPYKWGRIPKPITIRVRYIIGHKPVSAPCAPQGSGGCGDMNVGRIWAGFSMHGRASCSVVI